MKIRFKSEPYKGNKFFENAVRHWEILLAIRPAWLFGFDTRWSPRGDDRALVLFVGPFRVGVVTDTDFNKRTRNYEHNRSE